jgi:2-polyprenyl-6-methoxyphenol hydroxylase-like FAD-dependent oxidoreductase
MATYDVITVGGGLAGAAVAKGLAERGRKVLVLERETAFRDRVRGEQIHPWGIAELKELGLYDAIMASCGHELPMFTMYSWPVKMVQRDLSLTTPQQSAEVSFYHPAMQQTVLDLAAAAGAEIRRGVRVTRVDPGAPARVTIENEDGAEETLEARLVVGADGRRSLVRQWAGFETKSDPPGRFIAGVLFEGSQAPADTSHVVFNSQLGRVSALFPQKDGRLRAYLGYPSDDGIRLSGDGHVRRFIDESIACGAPPEYFEGAIAGGPLATFDGTDTWVDHPYRDGVALVGDAAASNDPSYGEGLSLTVRDARMLRDRLLATDDWDAAGHAYAEDHDRSYRVIHEVSRLFTAMFLERGPEADARRGRAFPRFATEPMRVPDHLFSGPDLPYDGSVRARFFAEDGLAVGQP